MIIRPWVYPAYRLSKGLDKAFLVYQYKPRPVDHGIPRLAMGLSISLDKPSTRQAFLVGPSKPRPVDHWLLPCDAIS